MLQSNRLQHSYWGDIAPAQQHSQAPKQGFNTAPIGTRCTGEQASHLRLADPQTALYVRVSPHLAISGSVNVCATTDGSNIIKRQGLSSKPAREKKTTAALAGSHANHEPWASPLLNAPQAHLRHQGVLPHEPAKTKGQLSPALERTEVGACTQGCVAHTTNKKMGRAGKHRAPRNTRPHSQHTGRGGAIKQCKKTAQQQGGLGAQVCR